MPSKQQNKSLNHYDQLSIECRAIFEAKNKDYGDSFREDGLLGVLIRSKDKLNRAITLASNQGEAAVRTETMRDTLLDLSNYAKMGVIVHEDPHLEDEVTT